MYLADLDRSTEIVLRPRRRRGEIHFDASKTGGGTRQGRELVGMSGAGGSASRAAAGAFALRSPLVAWLTQKHVLKPFVARLLALLRSGLFGVVAALSFVLVV